MGKDYEFCIIDPNNEKELEDYEKACFTAFSSEKSPDRNSIEYSIVENGRMRSEVSYNDLIQYACKMNNKIEAGLKVNINSDNKYSFENIFIQKKDTLDVEGINFFVIPKFSIEIKSIIDEFMIFVFNDLKNKGYKNMWGDCNEKLKYVYIYSGFEILDSKNINGVNILLIKKKL